MRLATDEDFRKHVAYEWAVETVDEYGDVVDVNHSDTYAEAVADAKRTPLEAGEHIEIALKRVVWSEAEGREDIQYGYLDEGMLPERFDEGSGKKVPERFHAEVRKVRLAK